MTRRMKIEIVRANWADYYCSLYRRLNTKYDSYILTLTTIPWYSGEVTQKRPLTRVDTTLKLEVQYRCLPGTAVMANARGAFEHT